MNKYKIILDITALFVSALAIALCLHWFSWKLIVVIALFTFANNLNEK